ncbi:MAG: hypothetical protein HYY81_13235 [Deltaproteobacteria bacterium]|nr:hypothetical protein [Deltaproteobacteria bacterium]
MEPDLDLSGCKILIAGCGAIGSVFGCLLRKAGYEVTLLGREWHLAAIRLNGLEMDGIWGRHRAEGFRLCIEAGNFTELYDLILVSVKAYDTEKITQLLAPYLKPDGIAISLQNGLGNVETLAEKLGAGKSMGASDGNQFAERADMALRRTIGHPNPLQRDYDALNVGSGEEDSASCTCLA